MKKFTVLLIAFALCFSITACEEKYNLSKFEEMVRAGNYAEAMAFYTETASANAEGRNAIIGVLKNIAEGVVRDYFNDSVTYESAEMQLDFIQRFSEDNNISEIDIQEYTTQLTKANISKLAYSSGTEFMKSKNYLPAIEQFKRVTENDSYYTDAQEQITAATEAYKEEIAERAKKSAEASKYDEALEVVSEALLVFKDDNDLQILSNTYAANYITQIIQKADAAFINPETDYAKAIDVLRPAMQKYPKNQILQDKYDSYMQCEPVSIFDMEPYTYDNRELNVRTVTDNMGNVYEKAFLPFNYIYSEVISSTYDIGKRYNLLKGTVAITKGATREETGSLKIYGDGRLLKEIKTNKTYKPQELSLDITGITDLKIEFSDTSRNRVIFANVLLQKTAK